MVGASTPLDRVKALLAALPKEEQEQLHAYLDDILVSPDEAESFTNVQVASLTDTRSGKTITYTFRQEHVRCGKDACWCSGGDKAAGTGHGPYTYKYWKEDGRLRKAYVGGGRKARRQKTELAVPPEIAPTPRARLSRPSGTPRAAPARGSSGASRSGPTPRE